MHSALGATALPLQPLTWVRACRFRGGPLKRGEVLHGIYGGTKSTHAGSYDGYECCSMLCAQIAPWVCAWVSLQDGMS